MNDRNRGWVAAFLLLGIAFLSAIFAAQGALLTAMIDAYALRASSQGAANAAAFAGGLAALVTAFFLQGRKRKRTLLKWAIALCVAALVLLWLAPGYALFSAVWFALGYGAFTVVTQALGASIAIDTVVFCVGIIDAALSTLRIRL